MYVVKIVCISGCGELNGLKCEFLLFGMYVTVSYTHMRIPSLPQVLGAIGKQGFPRLCLSVW